MEEQNLDALSLKRLKVTAELALYLLIAGMATAAAGVGTAVVLFIAYSHTTTDVCRDIDSSRSRLCVLDDTVKVSLPTLSFTAVLSPERWYFIYGLSTAAVLLGIAYSFTARVYAWHVASQVRRRRRRGAAGRTMSRSGEDDIDDEYIAGAAGCDLSCAALGWPFCWVRLISVLSREGRRLPSSSIRAWRNCGTGPHN